MLTGESLPVLRTPRARATHGPAARGPRHGLQRYDAAPRARPRAVVLATGMATELGRIAALSQRVDAGAARWSAGQAGRRLIALVAVGMGVAFIPLGTLRRRPVRSATPWTSRSACSSPTSPRACCRRSPWRSPSASRRLPAKAPWSSASPRRRDPRVDQRDLHRQDRHADAEPDAGGRAVDGRRDAGRTGATTAAPPTRCVARARRGRWSCNNATSTRRPRRPGDPTELALLPRRPAPGPVVPASTATAPAPVPLRPGPAPHVHRRPRRRPVRAARQGRPGGASSPAVHERVADGRRPAAGPTRRTAASSAGRRVGARTGLRVLAVADGALPDRRPPDATARSAEHELTLARVWWRWSTRRGRRSAAAVARCHRGRHPAASWSPATTG